MVLFSQLNLVRASPCRIESMYMYVITYHVFIHCSVGSSVCCHRSASCQQSVALCIDRCGQTTATLWVDSMQELPHSRSSNFTQLRYSSIVYFII